MGIAAKIDSYLRMWAKRDYGDLIPEEVPDRLMDFCLAPSWKAVAIAILKNDHACQSLGFTPKRSAWYGELKKMEFQEKRDAEIIGLERLGDQPLEACGHK